MISGLRKVVQQSKRYCKIVNSIGEVGNGQVIKQLQRQQQFRSVVLTPLNTFARQNHTKKMQVEKEQQQQQQQEKTEQSRLTESNQSDQSFEFTADTFNQILQAIESKGQSTIEAISNSDLRDRVLKSKAGDRNTFILCLKVLQSCNIDDDVLRDEMVQQLKQPHIYDSLNYNEDVGVILQYFVNKLNRKQYMVELEEFFISRFHKLNEAQIQQIMLLYVDNYKGSTSFYKAIQERLLQLIEEGNATKNRKVSFNTLMTQYLSCFTKSNYLLPEMEAHIIKEVEEKILSPQYQNYFNETVLPYTSQILYLFALQYENTKHLHDKFLSLIKINHDKNKQLPQGISYSLSMFLKVHQIYSSKEIDPFFIPAMRQKNKTIQTSITQNQISKYIEKFIPRLHLKENFDIDNFNVDFYSHLHQHKIIIELNGRFHYFHNRYSGIYEIKRKCLKKLGYVIIEIKDYDFKKLKDDKERYLFIAKQLYPYVPLADKYFKQYIKDNQQNQQESQQNQQQNIQNEEQIKQ